MNYKCTMLGHQTIETLTKQALDTSMALRMEAVVSSNLYKHEHKT